MSTGKDAGTGSGAASPAGSHDFAAVLIAAQHDAPWACTLLWVQYSPAVAAFLRSRGSAEPDDLTSEVFLAVFSQLKTFTGGEREFRSFVFSIAYRRLVDELRQRERRGATVELTHEVDRRSSPSAEEEALDRVGEELALELLDGLPDDQRNVMVLRIVGDLTIDQIAEVLGKRSGAIKALQRRALASLRKKLS